MYLPYLKKQHSLVNILSVFLLAVFLFACKKNVDTNTDEPNFVPDLVTKVTSSVSGFVTNQNNIAVAGAVVKVGTATTSTDRYGYFEVKNVLVVKEAATVEINYSGYFKAIKTYMATEGKVAFFRIKLLQKTIAGTINAGSGGNVSLSNGMNISLPANAVKNAANGSAYTGTVNIAAQYIDPTSGELNKIMPGDLRGINADGNIKGLTSYGMMAVELTATTGELLQIADGKKAMLTFPVPASMNSSAPSTIPLWYFDESKGLWKEEGAATKTGNVYVGEVIHFSYWNCDIPNAIVPLTFTVVDLNNNPVEFAYVEIIPQVIGSPGPISGYTDSTGYVSVFVTPNTTYELRVNIGSGSGCGNAVLQTFAVGSTPADLGNIVLPTSFSIATISGTVTNCNGDSVTDGFIQTENNGLFTRYNLYQGSYNFHSFLCNGNNDVNFIAVNSASSQQSQTIPVRLVPGQNNIANIQACGVSTEVYLNFTINGRTFVCSNQTGSGANTEQYGVDSIRTHVFWSSIEVANGIPMPNSLANTQFIFWNFGALQNINTARFLLSIAPHAINLLNFSVGIQPLSFFSNNYREIPVNITEYGAVGQFIAGSYSGRLYEDVYGAPDLTRPYDVSCNFRVKRNN